MDEVEVRHNPEQHRYEALDGETLAGFASYIPATNLLVFDHTEVDPAYEGRGVGSALARAGLDDVRERGLQALPVCSFIRSWVGKHPEYRDVVYPARASTVTD